MSIIFKKTCLYVGILPRGAGAQVNASVHMKDGEGAQSEVLELNQNGEILNMRYLRGLE